MSRLNRNSGSGLGLIGQGTSKAMRARAKALRANPTPAEAMIWDELRRNRLGGFHFRRQQVIHGFVVDFACDAAKLVIELDGSAHDSADQREYDEQRSTLLESMGLRVVRFTNHQVMTDLWRVLRDIRDALGLDQPEPECVPLSPLPVRGGAGGGENA